MTTEKKDVHTEHCCVIHGCKYGDEHLGCTVYDGFQEQSFPCETCEEEGITIGYLKKYFNEHREERYKAFKIELDEYCFCEE
jgi:hypothetical protein